MKILLVEDNPVDRLVIDQSLKSIAGFSYELQHCGSLQEAIACAKNSTFDVMLLDLFLPDSEGLETCVRAIAQIPRIPIVVMTGVDNQKTITEALNAGVHDYLVKGRFSAEVLVRVLRYAIDRHAARCLLVEHDENHFQILNHIPAVVWTADRDLRFTSSLGAGLKQLDLQPNQVVGTSLDEFFGTNGSRDAAIAAHRNALSGHSESFEIEWHDRTFEVQVAPLHAPDGQVVGVIGVALDVTERRRIDKEITFASAVQQSLLPSDHPQLPGFEIFGAAFPARQTSGDWFDYLRTSTDSVGLVVGDVSSKGFGPAIMSAVISSYLDALTESTSDLSQILAACNQLVCRHRPEGRFAVVSLARLNETDRVLEYVGAGEAILIVGGDGKVKHKLGACGLPIGILPDAVYAAPTRISLAAGDVILMLTDGFREASNTQWELFGQHRIVSTVATNLQRSARDIMVALREAALRFADEDHPVDDMTGIVVKALAQ